MAQPEIETTTAADIATVYVLTYNHKHGTDVSVYRTHDGAIISIFEIVLEYLSEVEDREKRSAIREAVKQRSLAKVSELWAEATEEGFDIDTCAVIEDEADLEAAIQSSEQDDADV